MPLPNERRPLYAIANDIEIHWKKVNYAAKPYLKAMGTLRSIEDAYVFDSGRSVVLYFLANAATFRGADARRIKKELKALL